MNCRLFLCVLVHVCVSFLEKISRKIVLYFPLKRTALRGVQSVLTPGCPHLGPALDSAVCRSSPGVTVKFLLLLFLTLNLWEKSPKHGNGERR